MRLCAIGIWNHSFMDMKKRQFKIKLLIALLGLFGISCTSCKCEYGGDEDIEWEERNRPHHSEEKSDVESYDSTINDTEVTEESIN